MFILYLLLSVFIGSIQEAIISISFDRPSVCGCWLAETCIWYFAVWLVMRVFSRAVVTLPLISALINQSLPGNFCFYFGINNEHTKHPRILVRSGWEIVSLYRKLQGSRFFPSSIRNSSPERGCSISIRRQEVYLFCCPDNTG